jgi:hypothetical protein
MWDWKVTCLGRGVAAALRAWLNPDDLDIPTPAVFFA